MGLSFFFANLSFPLIGSRLCPERVCGGPPSQLCTWLSSPHDAPFLRPILTILMPLPAPGGFFTKWLNPFVGTLLRLEFLRKTNLADSPLLGFFQDKEVIAFAEG